MCIQANTNKEPGAIGSSAFWQLAAKGGAEYKAALADAKTATEAANTAQADYQFNLSRMPAATRDTAAAKKLVSIGETQPDATLNVSDLAAWTMTANLVLNIDEVLNKG